MPANRIQRLNSEAQRVMSGLLRSLKDPRVAKAIPSVNRVEVTNDLSYAKIYVSGLNKEVSDKELKSGLDSAAGYLRRELSGALQFRKAPELRFIIDDSIERGARVLGIMDSLGNISDRSSNRDGND